MLRRWGPDLVLLDLGLPDMDGLRIIERMQADAQWRAIPIVVVTGRDEMGNLPVLKGGMFVGKADGLMPGELVRWIQSIVDTTTHSDQRSAISAQMPMQRGSHVRCSTPANSPEGVHRNTSFVEKLTTDR